MCGVFGYIGSNEAAPDLVLDGLKRLEYRGYDSWGVAVVPAVKTDSALSQIVVKKKVGKIGAASVAELPAGTLAFGHTRWATNGGVTQANAHPHLDCEGKIAVVHNGIFENYAVIKQTLAAKGHKFLSETDTEVVAHLIEEHKKTQPFVAAVRRAFLEMEGLNAIVAVDVSQRLLVALRNGSPLVLGFGSGENYLASDPAALLPYTKDVYFLEDNEMAIVTEKKVTISNSLTQAEKKIIPQHLTWDVSQTEKGDYAYFMEKEIYEQPAAVAAIAANAGGLIQKIAEKMAAAKQTYLVGCGTASYAALAGTYLFSKIAHRHVDWKMGSEFGYDLHYLGKGDLVLALSQSGETIDILGPLKTVKVQGAEIIAIVNVLGSSLYRLADEKILIGVGPETAVASTKAFTGKIAYLVLLAYAMAHQLAAGKKVVALAAQSAAEVLSESSVQTIVQLAKKLKTQQHLYVLGRGISYPLSLETAIKIKEISYIHAEGLATGELKHGPLALIEKGTPCLVYLPDDEAYADNLVGAREVKARGGYVIGVSFKNHEVFDTFIEVKDAQEATIIPNVVVAQLLAYFLAVEKGFDPDKPRNLAKSVTVK